MAIAGDSNVVVTDAQGNVHIGDIVYAKTEVEELREALRSAVNTLRNNLTHVSVALPGLDLTNLTAIWTISTSSTRRSFMGEMQHARRC